MAKKRLKNKRNRVEFLKEMYVPKIKESEFLAQEIGREFEGLKIDGPLSLFQAFVNADPSDNNKFLVWMLERFLKTPTAQMMDETGGTVEVESGKRLIVEDLDKTAGFLDFFNKFNDKFDENKRNINDYMSVDSFFDVVEDKMPKDGDFMSASQMERQFKQQIDIWLDNENWKVVVPKTYEASCAYGKNSRWCTASTTSRSQFDYHDKKGPLIILINKKADLDDRKTHKFQFHFETNQFMDAQDISVKKGYLDMISADQDLLNSFLKNIKDQHSFLIRLKLNLPIPEEAKVIKDVDSSGLDVSDMKANSLPDGLEVHGNLKISGNKNIKHLKNIKVFGNLMLDNSSIEEIGTNVFVKGLLDASGCSSLVKIEDGLIVGEEKGKPATLKLNDCTSLERLPNKVFVGGNMYASGCSQIDSIPNDIKIKYGLYLRNTKFSKMIKSGEIEFPTDITGIGKNGNEIFCQEYE